jgi:hypothetical protein
MVAAFAQQHRMKFIDPLVFAYPEYSWWWTLNAEV